MLRLCSDNSQFWVECICETYETKIVALTHTIKIIPRVVEIDWKERCS